MLFVRLLYIFSLGAGFAGFPQGIFFGEGFCKLFLTNRRLFAYGPLLLPGDDPYIAPSGDNDVLDRAHDPCCYCCGCCCCCYR